MKPNPCPECHGLDPKCLWCAHLKIDEKDHLFMTPHEERELWRNRLKQNLSNMPERLEDRKPKMIAGRYGYDKTYISPIERIEDER